MDLLRAFKSTWMGGASSMPNGESTGEDEQVSFVQPLTKSIIGFLTRLSEWIYSIWLNFLLIR
jgi:hypothetical protein